MRVRRPLSRSTSPTKPLRSRPGVWHRRAAAERAPEPTPEPDRRELLVRESGGPQDLATYSCSCGMQFTASVGTAVSCPHCGDLQDW